MHVEHVYKMIKNKNLMQPIYHNCNGECENRKGSSKAQFLACTIDCEFFYEVN